MTSVSFSSKPKRATNSASRSSRRRAKGGAITALKSSAVTPLQHLMLRDGDLGADAFHVSEVEARGKKLVAVRRLGHHMAPGVDDLRVAGAYGRGRDLGATRRGEDNAIRHPPYPNLDKLYSATSATVEAIMSTALASELSVSSVGFFTIFGADGCQAFRRWPTCS